MTPEEIKRTDRIVQDEMSRSTDTHLAKVYAKRLTDDAALDDAVRSARGEILDEDSRDRLNRFLAGEDVEVEGGSGDHKEGSA